MEKVVTVILLTALASLAIYVVYQLKRVFYGWRNAETRRLMDGWAVANGVRIVAMHWAARSWGRVGPFFVASSAQVLVRATVADWKGRERSGWFLLGGFFRGLLSDRVVVKWDDRDENPAGTVSAVHDSWLGD